MKDQINILDFQEQQYNSCKQKDKFIELLKKFHKNGILDRIKYLKLYPSSTGSPRMFASIKLHKPLQPLRLMVDFNGAHYYAAAQYINILLLQYLGYGAHTVKSSIDFINRIKNVIVPEEHILASLDITQLYGSINREDSINIIQDNLSKNAVPHNLINFIISTLNWISNNIVATFEQKTYSMLQGWPMGLPCSGVLSSMVVDAIEEKVINPYMMDNPYIIYLRYVDDVFICAPPDIVNEIFTNLNKASYLMWTKEIETDQSLKFLDLRLTRIDHSLDYCLALKPQNIRGRVDMNSCAPIQHKLAAFKSFLHRNDKLTKLEVNKTSNTITYVQDLLRNSMPRSLIHKTIIKHRSKNKISNELPWKVLPYIPGITYKIANAWADKFNTALRNSISLNRILNNTKDTVKTDARAKVVYAISCSFPGCHYQYIGETKANLATRIKQHRNTYLKAISDSTIYSVFNIHTISTNHIFDFSKVRILIEERNDRRRKIREALYIARTKDVLNNRNASVEINKFWQTIPQ